MNKIILKSITLQNFATFENQTIDFQNGFNSIVGETGSGKSLILDAFQFILGQRADKKVIRKNETFAVIESMFEISSSEIKSFLLDNGFPIHDQLIIKRIINSEGSSKCYLNNLSCTLSFLGQFTTKFVDLVGQFENQKLLNPDYQIDLIDYFSNNQELLKEYNNIFKSIKLQKKRLDEKIALYKNLKEKEDYLKFQIEEIEKISPSENNEKELLQEKIKLQNKNKFQKNLQLCEEHLSQSPHSIISQLGSMSKLLMEISGVDETLHRIEATKNDLEDISFELAKLSNEGLQEGRLDIVVDTLDKYQQLKMKFGGSIKDVLFKLKEFKNDIGQLDKIRIEISKLKDSIAQSTEKLSSIAKDLHQTRVHSGKKISSQITKFIRKLNMTGATIKISFDQNKELGSKGISSINFLAETNPGEGFHPIKDIASGGELSRILLGVRNIVANTETISIFFFDEIDTGIGGNTAKKIGNALKEISLSSQVLAITHLPQIANFSDSIVHVAKKTVNKNNKKRTYSFVQVLDGANKSKLITEMNSIS